MGADLPEGGIRRAEGLAGMLRTSASNHRGITKTKLGAGQRSCFPKEKKDEIPEITCRLACGQTPEKLQNRLKRGVCEYLEN